MPLYRAAPSGLDDPTFAASSASITRRSATAALSLSKPLIGATGWLMPAKLTPRETKVNTGIALPD